MIPIDDFELVWSLSDSRYHRPGEPPRAPIEAGPPAANCFQRFGLHYMGEEKIFHTLMYRGSPIESVFIEGHYLVAQYKCKRGYLFISSYSDLSYLECFKDIPSNVSLFVHFVFEDFSGVEWEILDTDCPRSICRDPGVGTDHRHKDELAPFDVCQPLGENELVIRLKDREVYRISVHVPPERFLLARDESNHFGPSFLGRRYLKIRSVAAPWKLGIPALSD